ncbi:bifunctional transaldolase/phosoglucose isomerase [Gluconacetobacter entanii]|uniref:bifunctional transaldolase/phosoglucose isomerase n=1 Tax=Gluconacetobacter entanii TaxID=108528 RepID=UPI001C931D1E|nr:bifunctional transaldolase/phosoglucose isomerase [Gluconacetobacter entanii]MBY4639826.1 bifunctional transaldolase/phosoglucose isomerase [Gluconacetobacter entanii]MCW4579971.1 bifunctional transaldolase/phosoglucose isomerase [Gluconacetobacter entanii]MCW4583345.1 bifunctional transaldolase/phosoglucose isomerase [Gluconacetobacter entanii]MCW4586705.1 bifunctional transaldolase/phosoglucose isomerase [Gluconacetobacter entanii]
MTAYDAGTSEAANPLKQLARFGQSPWLDFIQRSYTESGKLKKLVEEDGLKGVTSNPSIFQKAMGHGTDYDPQIRQILEHQIVDAGTLYETLAIHDIRAAAKVLHPVYEQTKKVDGYVSLEVSPYLARDTSATIAEARRLWLAVGAPNLMIKIPGTDEGAPAVQTAIAAGINVNVTLLFSLNAYKKVVEAYIAGLEDRLSRGESVTGIASVASFFVSRIDVKIDKEIDDRIAAGDRNATALKALRGKVAIANAKQAYEYWQGVVKSPRWQKLAQAGAMPQRLLWASTSTKDRTFSDVLYVDGLIGPETVNTIPPATFDDFRDHGKVAPTLTQDVAGAYKVISEARRLGLDLDGVTRILVDEGVRGFEEAFDALLGSIAAKQAAFLGHKLTTTTLNLPADLDAAVRAELETWRTQGNVRRLWNRDATLWTGHDEASWLKWLSIVDDQLLDLAKFEEFQAEVKARGFRDALLLGMGGSSLGPEVLSVTFGKHEGFPRLYVLDSTDPQQIRDFQDRIDISKTLFIVSSKSGGTLEPNILKAYFFAQAKKVLGDKAGSHFITVTDPGSHMEDVAKKDGFWKIFYGNKQIGGRYSVLSDFGMVPAAVAGLPLKRLLDSALRGEKSCAASVPPAQNPGVVLGTVLGVAARNFGRDKVTLLASPAIYDMGAWLEQLLAESTGKDGRGLIPIDGETAGPASVYGKDRVFIYLRLSEQPCEKQDAAFKKLIAAGEPVVTIELHDRYQIAEEFFRWEFATAVAGSIIGINAFNQPDVEASKIETKKITTAYNETGRLPPYEPFAKDGSFAFYADPKNAAALRVGHTAEGILRAHFARGRAGDYVALLAYIDRDTATREWLQQVRLSVRDGLKLATAAEFGPRFQHSTGQAYKGGPNTGIFLQITCDDEVNLPVPGEKYTFSIVKEAQARGDLEVLGERGRRALRVHIHDDLKSGLEKLAQAIKAAV